MNRKKQNSDSHPTKEEIRIHLTEVVIPIFKELEKTIEKSSVHQVKVVVYDCTVKIRFVNDKFFNSTFSVHFLKNDKSVSFPWVLNDLSTTGEEVKFDHITEITASLIQTQFIGFLFMRDET